MNINDYIKDATSKIFDTKEKHKVEAELNDHMFKHKEFYEEIGYDAETAEEMAVEKMGDGIEIAEQLGTLHNDFYTPAPDIIAAVIWLAILGGVYYLLNKYIFDDIGAIAISLSSIFFAVGIFSICSFFTVKRNKVPISIINFIGGIGTTVFSYFVSANINKNVFHSNNLIELLLNGTVPLKTEMNNAFPIIVTTVIGIAVALITIISVSYSLKTKSYNNSLFDNHFAKAVSDIAIVLAVISVITGTVCFTRFFAFQNTIQEKYSNDYKLALDIAEKCDTVDDIVNYINNCPLNFTESKENNEIIGYTYNSEIGNIVISFKSYDENQKETAYDRLMNRFANSIKNAFPESAEKQYDYTINLTASNIGKYKNGYDSISLSKLHIKPEELDQIYNFTSTETINEEQLEFFDNYLPKNLYITPSNDKYKHDSEAVYTFTAGKGKNSFDTDFNITILSEKFKEIQAEKEHIIEFLRDNPNATNNEIAEKFNCKLIAPEYSYNDYSEKTKTVYSEIYSSGGIYASIEYNGNTLTDEEIRKSYDNLFTFQLSDDLIFQKSNIDNSVIILFSSYTNIKYFSIEDTEETPTALRSSYSGIWRKTELIPDNIFFDCHGLKYKNREDIPYYTKSGKRFRFNYDKESNLYYLIGTNGDKYEADFGYIDENSNLYFFSGKSIPRKDSQNELLYYDENGKKYTKALETNWDESGNLIDFEEYLPTNN